MKKDIETKLIIERDRRLRELPDFVADFIFSIEQTTSIRTQIAYIKDIDIFFHYLKELPEYSNKDIMNYSPTDFRTLNERDIRDFLKYLSDFKRKYRKKNGSTVEQEFSNSPSGKARKKATLSTFWEYLIDNEYVDKNIIRKVDIKVPRKTLVTNMLEEDEINNFLDTIINDYNIETQRELLFHQRVKFRDYVMVLLMGFTGIRVSELVQLDIDDININHETMLIIRKGGKQAEKYIPESILKPISEYINLRKGLTDVLPAYKNALFISQHKKRIDPRTVRYMLRKYKNRCGIDIKITPHTFRRSYGMELLEKTGNIELVRQELGHETIETTRKSYAQVKDKTRKEIIKNFDYGNTSAPVRSIDNIRLNKLSEKTGLSVEELLELLQ